MKKSALITGASGFIGNYLVQELLRCGWTLTCVVRRSSSYSFPADVAIIELDDISGKTSWDKTALQNIDVVFHLAARVHIFNDASKCPSDMYTDTNVNGTARLVRACLEAGVNRFVYLSSIGVNGPVTFGEGFTEQDEPKPETPYAKSKLAAEIKLQSLLENQSMSYTILRPPLVYGPGNPGNMLRLIKLVQTGLPLPLSHINNKRSMISIKNLVDSMIQCSENAKAKNNLFLVSDRRSISTTKLIRILKKRLQNKNVVFYIPRPLLTLLAKLVGRDKEVGQLMSSLEIDSNYIRDQLNWVPEQSVEDGLMEMVDSYLLDKTS